MGTDAAADFPTFGTVFSRKRLRRPTVNWGIQRTIAAHDYRSMRPRADVRNRSHSCIPDPVLDDNLRVFIPGRTR